MEHIDIEKLVTMIGAIAAAITAIVNAFQHSKTNDRIQSVQNQVDSTNVKLNAADEKRDDIAIQLKNMISFGTQSSNQPNQTNRR